MSLSRQTGHCSDFEHARRFSRRQALQAGGLGLLGLGLTDLLAARSLAGPQAAASGFGKAKSCILLFMWGGPSQLDTFDLKPDAPAEVRGEFQPTSTCVPGVQICQHFQHLAQATDRVCLVRSLTHTDPAHLSSGHATLTGNWAPVINSDAEPPSERDSPHIGSVVSKVKPAGRRLPSFVTLPWLAYHPAAPGGKAPGQNGGWLGKSHAPMLLTGDPNAADWKVDQLTLADSITAARLDHRRELLRHIDRQRAALGELPAAVDMTGHQEKAFGLLTSGEARAAFDLTAEPDKTRERYGRNIHGQCVLLARRLVEHGVPLVSVNWHNDGHNFWDTHGNNFNRLKNDLIPPADRALAALLDDLTQRGLLEETLVVWVGEFGRRPQITSNNAGREHWPFCYSGLLAGGGIRGGAVYGASDAQAAYPDESPVSPLDFAATMYHALGIDPHATLPDSLGRPIRICEGTPVLPLFG
jgi:hypothetical protein